MSFYKMQNQVFGKKFSLLSYFGYPARQYIWKKILKAKWNKLFHIMEPTKKMGTLKCLLYYTYVWGY